MGPGPAAELCVSPDGQEVGKHLPIDECAPSSCEEGGQQASSHFWARILTHCHVTPRQIAEAQAALATQKQAQQALQGSQPRDKHGRPKVVLMTKTASKVRGGMAGEGDVAKEGGVRGGMAGEGDDAKEGGVRGGMAGQDDVAKGGVCGW